MKILFVQLPVPTLVPQQNIGNHLLASSSLILHLKSSKSKNMSEISVLPQELCSRAGDYYITDKICENKPDVVAFTCAVWNIERTLFIAEIIKSRIPQVKIWLGGPEVASDSFFLSDNNFPFDLAIEGEGEEIFRLLMEGTDPAIIDRVYMPSGIHKKSIKAPLLNNLSTIHEPFIQGFARMEQDHVVVSELFRGCKYGCLFCRYHSGAFKKEFSIRPYDQVASLFSWARQNGTKELFLLDPSFEQRPDIDSFLNFLATTNRNPVIPIFAELRAEAVDQNLAERLYNAGVFHVETGLQTITHQALQNVGRSFDKKKFTSGIRHLQSVGIKIRPDIMIGLPGDTLEGLRQTALFLKDLDLAQSAQVFKTQVLPGTKLRKNAERFSITYENRPPYQIISTPQLSKSELDESTFEAESLLDISCSPEERPVLKLSGDQKIPFGRLQFTSTDINYAYFFDCTTESGRDHFYSENFSKSAFTVSVTCKVNDYRYLAMIKDCVNRFYKFNPFSSSVVAFYIPPQFPLDIFDSIQNIGKNYSYSDYLTSIFPSTYSNTPNRRIIACLNVSESQMYSNSWLNALRELAEIVWLPIQNDSILHNVENTLNIENVDFIYIDTESSFFTNSFSPLSMLLQCEHSEQFIFSDVNTQWQYFELQSRSSV